MPGYDGTGPRGRGPMTGRGEGYCVVEMSDDAVQPEAGLGGQAGAPVTPQSGSAASVPAAVLDEIARVRCALAELQRRLCALESSVRRADGLMRAGRSGPDTSSAGGDL